MTALSNRLCTAWYSSSSRLLSSSYYCRNGLDLRDPWLMLPIEETDSSSGDKIHLFYSLKYKTVSRISRRKIFKVPDAAICFTSTRGWLGFVDPTDYSVYLSTPGRHCYGDSDSDEDIYYDDDYDVDLIISVLKLPSLATIPSVLGTEKDPKTGAITRLKMINMAASPLGYGGELELPSKWYHSSHEVATTAMKTLALSSPHIDRHFTTVAAIQGIEIPRLAFCLISDNENSTTPEIDTVLKEQWIGLQENYCPGANYSQVVFSHCKRRCYTLFSNTGIQVYDLYSNPYQIGNRSRKIYEISMDDIEEYIDYAIQLRLTNSSYNVNYAPKYVLLRTI